MNTEVKQRSRLSGLLHTTVYLAAILAVAYSMGLAVAVLAFIAGRIFS